MKHIEDTWIEKFKDEVRSLRLSIAMDGVNPYSLQNTNYYVWLVVVLVENDEISDQVTKKFIHHKFSKWNTTKNDQS